MGALDQRCEQSGCSNLPLCYLSWPLHSTSPGFPLLLLMTFMVATSMSLLLSLVQYLYILFYHKYESNDFHIVYLTLKHSQSLLCAVLVQAVV